MERIRIALISDTHNEFLRSENKPVPDIYTGGQKIDVLVLAGDIDINGHGAHWAVRQSELLGVPVIYVLGNHEYYKPNKYTSPYEEIREITTGTNVHVLDSETVVIKGVKFIGASLWIDFKLFGKEKIDEAMDAAVRQMNDFSEIRLSFQLDCAFIKPEDLVRWFEHGKSHIEREMQKPFDGKRIVVTHHAPSKSCLPEKDQDDILSAMYASNLDEFILKYQPDAWFYGHIHKEKAQRIGETLVMSRPRGYPHLQDEPILGYKPMIVVL